MCVWALYSETSLKANSNSRVKKYSKQSCEEKLTACCLVAPYKKNGSEVTKGTHLQRCAGFTLQKNVQVLCLSGGYLGDLFRLRHQWRVLVVHSQRNCFPMVSMDRADLHTSLEETEFPSLVHCMWVRFKYALTTCQHEKVWVVSYTSQIPRVLKSFQDSRKQKVDTVDQILNPKPLWLM